MSSFSFSGGGFQPPLPLFSYNDFRTTMSEGVDFFEPKELDAETGAIEGNDSTGESSPTYRHSFLRPHRALLETYTGQRRPSTPSPTSVFERRNPFHRYAQCSTEIIDGSSPVRPMCDCRSSLSASRSTASDQDFEIQQPMGLAGGSQLRAMANPAHFNMFTTLTQSPTVAGSWSHDNLAHGNVINGDTPHDTSRSGFYPFQETNHTYVSTQEIPATAYEGVDTSTAGEESSYNNVFQIEGLRPGFFTDDSNTSSEPAWGRVQPAATSLNLSADTSFVVENSEGLQQIPTGKGYIYSPGATPANVSLQASNSVDKKRRPMAKTPKSRTKVTTTNEEDESAKAVADVSEVPEPDETYAFTVTDWNDVYLDPKPTQPFGTHEPHLAKKVAATMKKLRVEKKSHGVSGLPQVTMTQLQASIKARITTLMSQPGPRPQTSEVAPSKQWDAPLEDYSIPTTAAAYAVCLHLLVNAIFNREGCMESENREFQNRYCANSTYYTEAAVYGLATQILDELINVHENGFMHETLDPDYDERYRKTQGFNFRDRFNVTARVLKHSKSTCNELFKNFRLHDVIGGAYDLETRIWSNYKNNKAKAEKEKKRREEEAANETGKKVSTKQGTKRNREIGGDETSSSGDLQRSLSKSNKRAKIQPSLAFDALRSTNKSLTSMSNGTIIEPRSSKTASAAVQEPLRRKMPLNKVTAATTPARQQSRSSVAAPTDTNESSSDKALPTAAKSKKPKAAKRHIRDVNAKAELPVPLVKKRKVGFRTKTASRRKAEARPAATEADPGDEFQVPAARSKADDRSVSIKPTKRTSTRAKKPTVGSATVSDTEAGATHLSGAAE